MAASNLIDKETMAKAKNGNKEAITSVYNYMIPIARRLAMRAGSNDIEETANAAVEELLFREKSIVESYNPERGNPGAYIKKALVREISRVSLQAHGWIMPERTKRTICRVSKLKADNPQLSDDEIMAELSKVDGISQNRAKEAMIAIAETKSIMSLSTVEGIDGDEDGGVVVAGSYAQPEEEAIKKEKENENEERMRQINKIIEGVKPKTRYIVEHSYGINGATKMTKEQIGENIGMSADNVRQTLCRWMKKTKKQLKATV